MYNIVFFLLTTTTVDAESLGNNFFSVDSGLIFKVIYSTIFLISVVYAVAHFVKKHKMKRTSVGALVVKDKICVSPKSTMYLVQVENKELIIIESSFNVSVTDVTTFTLNEKEC